MRNIRLLVEYDGTNYVGWQRQENGRSIQMVFEEVLAGLFQRETGVIGAGRTDAGVHARGQVANFRTDAHLTLHEIHSALNGLLPHDIVVLRVEEVPHDFHARFSAKARTYSYFLTMQPSALLRTVSWYVKYRLDLDLMRQCSREIARNHDFTSFCKTQSEVNNHLCEVSLSEWTANGGTLRYSITANRFLHGMVRALVGTMVDVGRGYTTPDQFLGIFEGKDRRKAGMAAPAKGLVLESVTY